MESNFNNRDFERFVQQNADQYRMFPTEKVWKGVHQALHSRRRWYGIGLALLLITTAVVTWVMLSPGNRENNLASASVKTTEAEKAGDATVTGVTSPVKTRQNNSPFITSPEDLKQTVSAVKVAGLADDNNTTTPSEEILVNENAAAVDPAPLAVLNPDGRITQKQNIFEGNNKKTVSPAVIATPVILPVNAAIAKADKPADISTAAGKKSDDVKDTKLPLIPERTAKPISKLSKKKLSWQLYLTPTVSYRKLAENTAFISAARYNSIVNGTGGALYTTDVNTMVNHKPDLGFQLGLRTAYPVSKWFSLTGGFQFSVSKYDIKAYDHPAEVTTIALTDRSVSAVSSLRNTNGYKVNWLRNFYFSASVPIGMELKLSDGDKNYFGIAGTIQPTYVLDNRAYLISADYKNYAEVPSLTRRWNMNTSFEIFSAHTTGKLKWRVGPQVRYQTMSSFVKNYPIKEHLFDFGLKLGIQLK
ncbi:MAG: hypothetical protein ACT4OJ_15600 [Bacteroidota bacterium]